MFWMKIGEMLQHWHWEYFNTDPPYTMVHYLTAGFVFMLFVFIRNVRN